MCIRDSAYADHAVPLGLREAAEVTYHCNTYGKGTDDGGDAHGNGNRRAAVSYTHLDVYKRQASMSAWPLPFVWFRGFLQRLSYQYCSSG